MHHSFSFTVHPCKCTQNLTNTDNRSICNPSPAVSLCTTHAEQHSVIIPSEHSVYVWFCVCLHSVRGRECFGSNMQCMKARKYVSTTFFSFFFFIRCGSQQCFTAVSMSFALFIIWCLAKVCLVCVLVTLNWPLSVVQVFVRSKYEQRISVCLTLAYNQKTKQ